MTVLDLNSLDLLSIGHEIQLYGAIYSGKGRIYFIPLPDENYSDLTALEQHTLVMDAAAMERFLRQTDVLDVQGPGKAILRKSQRQIDQAMAWRVFERDGYRCRYCGEKRPLTVDHVDLWEDGGVTVEANLISACRRCNKARGRMPYDQWLVSAEYQRALEGFESSAERARAIARNLAALDQLPYLKGLRVAKQRSR